MEKRKKFKIKLYGNTYYCKEGEMYLKEEGSNNEIYTYKQMFTEEDFKKTAKRIIKEKTINNKYLKFKKKNKAITQSWYYKNNQAFTLSSKNIHCQKEEIKLYKFMEKIFNFIKKYSKAVKKVEMVGINRDFKNVKIDYEFQGFLSFDFLTENKEKYNICLGSFVDNAYKRLHIEKKTLYRKGNKVPAVVISLSTIECTNGTTQVINFWMFFDNKKEYEEINLLSILKEK